MHKLLLTFVLNLLTFTFLKAAPGVFSATAPCASVSNDSTALKEYCGVYKMAENPYVEAVTIEIKDGKLISKTPEDEEIVLVHTEKDEFFVPPFSARAIFTRINGIVKGIKVILKGKEMIGDKQP